MGSADWKTATSIMADGLALDSPEAVRKVFEGCNLYFQCRPYRRWFDVLEKVLKYVRASYYNGSACHLDLVQWTTDPVWGGLEAREQDELLQSDIPFLRQQLSQANIRLLLLNGAGIMRAYEDHLGGQLRKRTALKNGRITIFSERPTRKLTVVGWNLNLQSSFGVSNSEIAEIGKRVAQVAKDQ